MPSRREDDLDWLYGRGRGGSALALSRTFALGMLVRPARDTFGARGGGGGGSSVLRGRPRPRGTTGGALADSSFATALSRRLVLGAGCGLAVRGVCTAETGAGTCPTPLAARLGHAWP